MRRKIFCIAALCSFITISSAITVSAEEIDADNYNTVMKQDILSLMMAYPEYVKDVEKNSDGKVYLVMKSGRKILYDDKRQKSFEEKLNNPDLQDMLEQIYPLTPVTHLMDKNFDPGRGRVYDLLKEVYGSSRQQVESSLVNVNIGGRNYQFNKNNGAAQSLKNVMKEVKDVSPKTPGIWSFVVPCSGTYNYRLIAGTGRLSPHSFGNTIDLARDSRDYWQWASPEAGEKRLLSYSKELVQIFERNNFIWGGKWGHFDILHFEYRPEIILKAKYFGESNGSRNKWYGFVPVEEATIKDYVEKIENTLK